MSKQRLEQKQYQKLSPQQIQFLGLLQIPIVSLDKRIEEELEENPALDEEELEDNQNPYLKLSAKEKFEDFQIEDKSESIEDYLLKQLIDLNLDDNTLFIAPYDGYLVKVILQSETDISTDAGSSRMQLRVNGTLSTYVTVAVADDTSTTFAFGASDSSWAFDAGDRIRISFDGGAAPRYITISSVWRYTI